MSEDRAVVFLLPPSVLLDVLTKAISAVAEHCMSGVDSDTLNGLVKLQVAKILIRVIDAHVEAEAIAVLNTEDGSHRATTMREAQELERSQLSAIVSSMASSMRESSILATGIERDPRVAHEAHQLIAATTTMLKTYQALAARHFGPLHRTFANKATSELRHIAEDPAKALLPHLAAGILPGLLKVLRAMEPSAPADYLLIATMLAIGTEDSATNDVFISAMINALRDDHHLPFGHRVDNPSTLSGPQSRYQLQKIFADRLLYRYPSSLHASGGGENSRAVVDLFYLSQVNAASPDEHFVAVNNYKAVCTYERMHTSAASKLTSIDPMTALLHAALANWCGGYGLTELASILRRGCQGKHHALDVTVMSLRDPATLELLCAGIHIAATWAFTPDVPRLRDEHGLLLRVWGGDPDSDDRIPGCNVSVTFADNSASLLIQQSAADLSEITFGANSTPQCAALPQQPERRLTYNGQLVDVALTMSPSEDIRPTLNTAGVGAGTTDEGEAVCVVPSDATFHLVARCCIRPHVIVPFELPETAAAMGASTSHAESAESDNPLEVLSTSEDAGTEDDDDETDTRPVDTPRNHLSSSKSFDGFFATEQQSPPTVNVPKTTPQTSSTVAPLDPEDAKAASLIAGPLTLEQHAQHKEQLWMTSTIFAGLAVRLYRLKTKFREAHPLRATTANSLPSAFESFVEYVDDEFIAHMGETQSPHLSGSFNGATLDEDGLIQLGRTPSAAISQHEQPVGGLGQYNDRGVRMTTAEVMWNEKLKRIEARRIITSHLGKSIDNSGSSHSPPTASLEGTLIVAQPEESEDLFVPALTSGLFPPVDPNTDASNRSTNTIAPPSVSGYPDEMAKGLPPNSERRPTLNGSESSLPHVVVANSRLRSDSSSSGIGNRQGQVSLPTSLSNVIATMHSSSGNHNYLHRLSGEEDRIISLNTSQIIARSMNSSPFALGPRRLKISQRTPIADFLESTQRSQTSAAGGVPVSPPEIEVLEAFPSTSVSLHKLIACLSEGPPSGPSQMLSTTLAPNTLLLHGSTSSPLRAQSSRPVSPSATHDRSVSLAANSLLNISCESPLRSHGRRGSVSPTNKVLQISSSFDGQGGAGRLGALPSSESFLRDKLFTVIRVWVVSRLGASWVAHSYITNPRMRFLVVISEVLSLLQDTPRADETASELCEVITGALLRIATGPTIKAASGPVTSSAIPLAGPVLGILPDMIPVDIREALAVPKGRYIHLTPYLWPQEQVQGTFQRLSAVIHSTLQQVIEVPQAWASIATANMQIEPSEEELVMKALKDHATPAEVAVAMNLTSISPSNLANPFSLPLRDWAFRCGLPVGKEAVHDRVASRDKYLGATELALVAYLRKAVQMPAAEKLLQWLEFVTQLLVRPEVSNTNQRTNSTVKEQDPQPRLATLASDVIMYCGQATCILRTAEAEEGPPIAVTQYFGRRLSESAHLQVQNTKHKYIPIRLHDTQFVKESVTDLRHSWQVLRDGIESTIIATPRALLDMIGQTMGQLQHLQSGIYVEAVALAMEVLSLPGSLADWLDGSSFDSQPMTSRTICDDTTVTLRTLLLDAWKCETVHGTKKADAQSPTIESRRTLFEATAKRPLRCQGGWYEAALAEETEHAKRLQTMNESSEVAATRLKRLLIGRILKASGTDAAVRSIFRSFDGLNSLPSLEGVPAVIKLLAAAVQNGSQQLDDIELSSTVISRATTNQSLVMSTASGPFRHATSTTALGNISQKYALSSVASSSGSAPGGNPLAMPTSTQQELKKKAAGLASVWSVQVGSLQRRLRKCVADLQRGGLLPATDEDGRQVVVDEDGKDMLDITLQLLRAVASL